MFKYLDMFLGVINDHLWFVGNPLPLTHWLLPIGISFYTFQTMSYSLDVYFKKLKPCSNMLEYLLYVTFFPQLVAGPILRANHFIPQIYKVFTFKEDLFFQGMFFIFLGLLKKVWIADTLGLLWVDPVYAHPENYGALDMLLATYAYLLQVFNDFSGYSDIAIGSALLFGYVVPINFDAPYRCNNPADFWNRWHISLSTWVRDYVFYPLMMKGRLKGKVKCNLFITILVIGVWHGANWTFALFGLHHACIGILHRQCSPLLLRLKTSWPRVYPKLAWLIYFHLICMGAIMFRAESVEHIGRIFSSIQLSFSMAFKPTAWLLTALLVAVLSHFPRASQWEACSKMFANRSLWLKVGWTWLVFCLLLWCDHLNQGRAAFIYFRF